MIKSIKGPDTRLLNMPSQAWLLPEFFFLTAPVASIPPCGPLVWFVCVCACACVCVLLCCCLCCAGISAYQMPTQAEIASALDSRGRGMVRNALLEALPACRACRAYRACLPACVCVCVCPSRASLGKSI
jgi:hypothetical protein